MEKRKVRLSIIIPCYNCESYLERSIDSIKKQNSEEIEVIFVDDGSRDNSVAVINQLLSDNKLNFKVIRQENSGVSVARNTGVKHANGEYLYFLDADDYISDNFLKCVENEMNYDIIFFNHNTITDEKVEVNKFTKNNIVDNMECMELLLGKEFSYHICACLFKRSIIEEENIKFTPGCRYGEDHEFIIKAIINSNNIKLLNESLFNYCIRDNSVTSGYPIGRLDSIYTASRVQKYLSLINNENIRLLSRWYLIDKIIYNVNEFCRSYKKTTNAKEIKVNMEEIISKNRFIIEEYRDNKSLNLKEKIRMRALITSPALYINLSILMKKR